MACASRETVSFPFRSGYNPAAHYGAIMREFILKRWFLLLLVGGVALAAVMPQHLRPVVGLLEPKVIVSVALFLMAWCLESRNLWSTLLRPWAAIWAVMISYGLMPALGWAATGLRCKLPCGEDCPFPCDDCPLSER